MNVVIGGVIRGDELQRVPGKGVSTVVIDGLDRREGKEASALANRHAGQLERNTGTECIQQETFQWVVVQGAVCVRNIESVVSGVKSSYGQDVSCLLTI